MSSKQPSSPSSFSEDDPQSDLSPYSTLTSSPVLLDILEQPNPTYDYLNPKVEDPFRDVPLFDYDGSLQAGLSDFASHQTRSQNLLMLTPTATPSVNSSVAPRSAKSTAQRASSPPKKGTFNLPAPLSELTKHMTHIPLRDMEAHAHRPLEVRLREVENKNGKIARPMNSFLLYRSAYAERTKEWCSKNNHQVVSRVSGASWPQETNEIREKYERLAIIERENHRKAHPDYKFTPNKTSIAQKRKRSADFGAGGFQGMEHQYRHKHQFTGDLRLSAHAKMCALPYGIPAPYRPSLDHANPYGSFMPMESWTPSSSGPAIDEYQQAMLRSQIEGNMMRADTYPLQQWNGQEFNFTPAFTPSSHRRTLEEPVQNTSHLSSSFANVIDPQLLEMKPVDAAYMPYADSQRSQITPAAGSLSNQLPPSVNPAYPPNDPLKFDYDGMNFAPGPFPMT
ncbi:hypothetical protein KEM54_006093 [Ascosphaera aggregata]|nr:hypothetical protein KEM54_006093 [Ascosphaera aggregata]